MSAVVEKAVKEGVKHAFLAPSSAKKWIRCGPSAQLEAMIPEEEDSEFAEEGTIAHLCAEAAANNHLFRIPFEKDDRFTREMYEGAKGWRELLESLRGGPENTIRIEDRANCESFIAPGHSGKIDAWGYRKADKKLWVADYKFGIGIRILAESNEQGMIYAGGLYRTLRHQFDIETLDIVIFQPRISPVPSVWTVKAAYLEKWLNEVVQPAAKIALSEDPGDFVPGTHCAEAFCKARFTCRARAEYATRIFKKHGTLSPKKDLVSAPEIAALLPDIQLMIKWGKDVERYAQEQATKKGVTFPGYKVVRGDGKRELSDIEKLDAIMEDYIIPPAEYSKRVPLTIKELEAKHGKDHELWSAYSKVQGGPILVPVSDGRPEWSKTDASAFDDDEEEEEF